MSENEKKKLLEIKDLKIYSTSHKSGHPFTAGV